MAIADEQSGFENLDPIDAKSILENEVELRLWPSKDMLDELAYVVAELDDHEERSKLLTDVAKAYYLNGYTDTHADIVRGPEAQRILNLISDFTIQCTLQRRASEE